MRRIRARIENRFDFRSVLVSASSALSASNQDSPTDHLHTSGAYRLNVLSNCGLFVAVVEVTVMSPRDVIVYTLPKPNETPVLVMMFVDEPASRVLRSYTPGGSAVNAPAAL